MNPISLRHNPLELIKLADFLQAENTEIFNKKFQNEDPDKIKNLADRFYFLFKAMKDYEEYRSIISSMSTVEEFELFLAKCDNAISIISKKVSSLGFPENGVYDISRQFLQKHYKDIDSLIIKINDLRAREGLYSLLRPSLRSEKKKVNNEFEGKDISGLSKDYTDWILKIFELSKSGGEAHSIDDIISLAKTFRSSEQKLEKKITEFGSYSEASHYLNDNSGVSKEAYRESIRIPAQENDMSRIIYDDNRWTVVLIGSTIGGQWWGRDTDFCISTIEGNLYSQYATESKIDPYFIIDKSAKSSDPMRKFTIAIRYKESGDFEISNDSYTMTDANNHGIDLDTIHIALGQDDDKIFESIMRDARTRTKNIGTINKNSISAKISEKDYDFIKKYEKEIIASDDLTTSALNGINNAGDAEKAKSIIKSYAEKKPYYFLRDFSDKPWAEHYIPTAAKSYAEKEPYLFLIDFSDKPWAEPYIDLAAKNCTEHSAYYFLRDFSDKPWAEPYIDLAAKNCTEKEPKHFLSDFINKPWAKDYIPTAAKNCAEKEPYGLLYYFSYESWAEPYIGIAAKNYAEKEPKHFLSDFINKPWANEPREDLDGKSFVQYAEELLQKKSSYSPKLTKLAKVLRSLGLSGEASSVLRIR